MAAESRELTSLPLNENARIAMRDNQKEKSLAIENKRRKAKGMEPLEDFPEEEAEDDVASTEDAAEDVAVDTSGATTSEPQTDVTTEAEEKEDEQDPDILLLQAGNILIDSLIFNNQSVASQP
jgi:carboxyl-terminal processing protease